MRIKSIFFFSLILLKIKEYIKDVCLNLVCKLHKESKICYIVSSFSYKFEERLNKKIIFLSLKKKTKSLEGLHCGTKKVLN